MDVDELRRFGIVFLVLAVSLGLGANILGDMQTTQGYETASITQETFTAADTSTYISLDNPHIVEGSEVVRNRSVIATLNKTTDYQMDYVSGRILCNSTRYCSEGAGDMNISYDWNYYNYDFNITGYGMTSLNTLAKWIPTMALVLVVVILIGLIFTMFGRSEI